MQILINIILAIILFRFGLRIPYEMENNILLIFSIILLVAGIYYQFVPMKKTPKNVIRVEDLPAYSRAVGTSLTVHGITLLLFSIALIYNVFTNQQVFAIPLVVIICNVITMHVVTMRYKKRKRQEDDNHQHEGGLDRNLDCSSLQG